MNRLEWLDTATKKILFRPDRMAVRKELEAHFEDLREASGLDDEASTLMGRKKCRCHLPSVRTPSRSCCCTGSTLRSRCPPWAKVTRNLLLALLLGVFIWDLLDKPLPHEAALRSPSAS